MFQDVFVEMCILYFQNNISHMSVVRLSVAMLKVVAPITFLGCQKMSERAVQNIQNVSETINILGALLFHQPVILSSCDFHQVAFTSTSIFITLSFCKLVISLASHFISVKSALTYFFFIFNSKKEFFVNRSFLVGVFRFQFWLGWFSF